ncbi:MAG: catechol 2,3-dioxygenase-like lactoylglutathione lyase family enzyme [Pirellulaceae bacterium]|jgi:catechol 2,3-dioxygenase-like lactoylglutathione lyase family enzyme
MPNIGILETCMYVDDLEVAERFYVNVLGLPVYARKEGRHCFLRCGNQMLLLFDATASGDGGGLPPHGVSGVGHLALGVPAVEIDSWRQKFAAHDVQIEQEVEWSNGRISLYFRDPAGNSLEVTSPTIWEIDEQAFGFGGNSA